MNMKIQFLVKISPLLLVIVACHQLGEAAASQSNDTELIQTQTAELSTKTSQTQKTAVVTKSVITATVPPASTPISSTTPTPQPTPTPTPTLESIGFDDFSSCECCTIPENIFGTIWRENPLLREKIGCVTGYDLHGYWGRNLRTWITTQSFEGGTMLWQSAHSMEQRIGDIYVLYADGSYEKFDDTYNRETDPYGGQETPPVNLFEPLGNFGKLWREQPGVREKLGWATSLTADYDVLWQYFSKGRMFWISQREEILVLTLDQYFVFDTALHVPPAPSAEDPMRLYGKWTERIPAEDQMAELSIFADGALTINDCMGNYKPAGENKIEINTDSCASPLLTSGVYEFQVDTARMHLNLYQKFELTGYDYMAGFELHQIENDYEIDWWNTGASVKEKQCEASKQAIPGGCTQLVEWTECEGKPPFATGYYSQIFWGDEVILNRVFEKAF